jgi:hypothetical protein
MSIAMRVFALLLLTLACQGQTLSVATTDAAATGDARAPDAAAFDAAASDAVTTPAVEDAASDLAPDGPPSQPPDTAGRLDDGAKEATALLATYQQFLTDVQDRLITRRASCFGHPIELFTNTWQPPAPSDDGLRPSLRLGLQRFDEASASACLVLLATASCDRIADILARYGPIEPAAGIAPCAGALVGTVPPGGPCLLAADCQSPELFTCAGTDTCQSCVPRTTLRLGDTCSAADGPCPLAAPCRPDPRSSDDFTCQPLGQHHEACRVHTDCAPGLQCNLGPPSERRVGVCVPEQPGTPCTGSWDCLYVYACVGAGPGTLGTCQLGKAVGEPCTVYPTSVSWPVYNDCADLLQCLDLDGKGQRCVSGSRLGEPCGSLVGPPTQPESWVGCLEGFCTATSLNRGSCVPRAAAGEACQSDAHCKNGLLCTERPAGRWVCAEPPPPVPLGRACDLLGPPPVCGRDAYCMVPSDDLSDPDFSYPHIGTCVPLRRLGETCRERHDFCEPLSQCLDGVCKRC